MSEEDFLQWVVSNNDWLTLERSESPANDPRCLASIPKVPHLGWKRTTPVGPALHFSLPSSLSDAEGIVMEGPIPQMAPFGLAGEINSE